MDNIFAAFLQTAGLYDSKEICEDNIADLIELLKGNVKISAYCKECKQERVFSMKPIEYYFETGPEGDEEISCASLGEEIESLQNMIFSTKVRQEKSSTEEWKWINWQIADTTRLMKLEYICSMDEKHHLDYIVLTTDNSMMKIGQYPSIADMTFPELDAYKHVISKQDRKELGTAIGLFASGIGAGSYVYLRRILERLIYQAKATAGDKVNDEEFEQARVAERIKMLQGYLPEILIKNTTIYGILSKGIHELSEEECKKYFPVVGEDFLKTAPKGFPKDFKYIDYLKCKEYTCSYNVPDDFFLKPDFLDKTEDVFRQFKRFADFINYTIDDFE